MTLKQVRPLQRPLPGYQRGCWEGDRTDQHYLGLVGTFCFWELCSAHTYRRVGTQWVLEWKKEQMKK